VITARGWALLTGAVALWGVGRFLGVAELYVVAVATAVLVVVGVVAVRVASATISVRRGTSATRLVGGSTGEVTIDLRNDARLPAALLLVDDACPSALAERTRFVVPGLRAGATARVAYPVTGRYRGRYTVGPVRVAVRDPFGVAERRRRYSATDELLVYPAIEALAPGVVGGGLRSSGSSPTRRLFNTGDEFYTMREYVTGDDLRQVHWPSTAHRQRLMVRQLEQPWEARGTVLVDTRAAVHTGAGPDATFEKAVSVAASVVWHLADRAFQLRLVTDADARPPAVEPWGVLLDRLAEIEPSRGASLAPALERLRGAGGGEGVLCAVLTPPASEGATPLSRHPEVRALLQAGRGYSARVAIVVSGHGGAQSRRRATPSDEAAQFAAVLGAAGWRATTLAVGDDLAPRWAALAAGRSARIAAMAQ
jgi:uncharacterized protein (DUF58 family)